MSIFFIVVFSVAPYFMRNTQMKERQVCITKMSIILVFLFLLFSSPLLGVGNDDCMPIRCSKHGPIIQSPFRHKSQHSQDCGYPGFDVYCDKKSQTVLELPFSVKLVVQKINYVSQILYLSDPEKCLPQKLRYLNLSDSQFHFIEKYLYDYDMFKCSASERNLFTSIVPCHGESNYKFYAVSSSYSYEYYSMTSCTKIYEISSIPQDIFDKNVIQFSWSEPACGSCEAQGKRCSLKNYTRGNQIQCIEKTRKNQGAPRGPLIAGAALGSFLLVITLAALFLLYGLNIKEKENRMKIEKFLEDYRALKPTRFCYSDIKRITNQFSEKLGEGGYGIVYKGKLSNEINVAVKVLNNSKAANGEEFVNEVGIIGRIHHINVVRLVGFCAEGFRRALIYEFLPNDSLEKFIFHEGSKRINYLGWQKLQDIALGIAKGIEYLHQGCDQQILHFDIKPHNILLDHNFNPKICDFGLAKLCSKEQSAITITAARGTMGYIAPEVLSRTFGKVSYKSDIYSFGMLLLEMVGGRKNTDHRVNASQVYFPQWIYNHLNLKEEFWSHIEEIENGNIARKLAIVGLWCIQWHPTDRPSMKAVVQMLEGDEDNLTMPRNPFPATNETNSSTDLSIIQELE